MTHRELFVASGPDRVAAWCHERLGPGALYVAPSAAARQAARRAALGERGVGVGVRIISASGLIDAVEARAGLPNIRVLIAPLRRLLLADAGRAATVPLFDGGPSAGALAALGRLISTLRLNGVGPDAYRAAGGDARAADAYARFEAARRRLGCADEADRLARAVVAMKSLGTVTLEDPVVSSRGQAEFLRALAQKADAVFVGVPSFSEAGPAATARAFFKGLGFAETADEAAPAPPELAALAGVGADGEVALVARRILRLLRSGTEAAQILGVAPNAAYLARLHDECACVGVPVTSPRRLDVPDVPLVRTLLEVFASLADAAMDTADRGLALLGTPYLGLSAGLHDRVHRRLTLAGGGNLRSWMDCTVLPEHHPARRLSLAAGELGAALSEPREPAQFATIVARLVLDFGFLASARRHYLAAGRDDALRADQQAWEVLQDALDEVGEAFRDARRTAVPAGEWLAEVTAALQGETVRLDHRGVRGVHLTVAGGGLPAADHVFAVGWREGVFPRRPREDPLLPDAAKARLNEGGARLLLTADQAGHDQERRDRIVRAARRQLVVSWPAVAADGAPQLRSFFAEDIGLTEVPPVAVGETTWPLDLAAGRAERLARAAVLVHHRPERGIGAERAALDTLLRGLGAVEARALLGELHAPQRIVIPADLTERIRRSAGNQSASQVNVLVRCLYEHFAERRLEIASLAAPEVGVVERGIVAHRVLADLALGGGFDPARAAEAFDRRWAEAVPPQLAANAEVAFEGSVLRAQVLRLVERERDLCAAVAARPALIEFGFGMPPSDTERRDPASLADGVVMELPAGAPIPSVTLRGSIDRVDVVEEDGRRYGLAIDYKSGKGESYGEAFAELTDFQLPIYCLALRAAGVEPVGGVFLGIASGERYGAIREDFADRFFAELPEGVIVMSEGAFARHLATALDALAEFAAKAAVPEVVVAPRNDDCKWCELAPVCRIGTFGVGRRGRDDD